MFTPGNNYTKLTNGLYGEIKGVELPFPGFPSSDVDICKLGVTCPTTANKQVTEKLSLTVSTSFPKITLTGEWKISGSTTGGLSIVACVEIPLQLT